MPTTPAKPATMSARPGRITGTVGPVVVDGEWTRVLTGTYEGQTVPGLYLGGLNWTHPALGDLDADGDARSAGRRAVRPPGALPQQGTAVRRTGRSRPASYAGVNTGGWAYPALADVDRRRRARPVRRQRRRPCARLLQRGHAADPPGPPRPTRPCPPAKTPPRPWTTWTATATWTWWSGTAAARCTFYRNTGTPTAPAWTHADRRLRRHQRAGRGAATRLRRPGRRRRPGPAGRPVRPGGLVRARRHGDQPHLDPPRRRPHRLWRRQLRRQPWRRRLERRRRARTS